MSKFTKKIAFRLFVLIFACGKMTAQTGNDTIQVQEPQKDSIVTLNTEKSHLNYKSLIIPAALIGYGVASLSVNGLKQLNFSTRDEINERKPDHIKLDS